MESRDTTNDFKNSSEYILNHFERFEKFWLFTTYLSRISKHYENRLWKIDYSSCTLKLRPVKLLFVIFGRLSYSFFVNQMVWGNGRLSYLILKNHLFFTEKWPISADFFARDGSNGLLEDFLPIRSTKDCIYNFRKTYFHKNERSKQ